jgi:hypothetical protein
MGGGRNPESPETLKQLPKELQQTREVSGS